MTKRPRGRAPSGKTWSEEEGGLVKERPAKKKPCGRPPKGKVWNEQEGVWVDAEKNA